jgi:very-short-patch-repair endonuclease
VPANQGPQLTLAQRLLLEQCQAWAPVAEFRFHASRRWRIDVAFPEAKLGVEIDGGTFVQGRHSRGAGIRGDMEKQAALAALGWRVIRVMPEHVENGTALAWVRKAIYPEATR